MEASFDEDFSRVRTDYESRIFAINPKITGTYQGKIRQSGQVTEKNLCTVVGIRIT